MLSKAAQEKLLKHLNCPAEKVTELLADGEVDIDIAKDLPKVHIYDDAGLDELKKNLKKGHTDAAMEVWGKSMNETHKLGLSTSDAKNPEKVVDAMSAKALADAKITPDAKVAELGEKIKNLQTTIDTKDQELTTWQTRLKDREVNDEYRSFLHPDRNPALDDAEWIERIKRNYELVEVDGIKALKDKSTGKIFNDNKENPIPAKDVLAKQFAEKEGWLKPKAIETAPPDPKKTHNPAKTGGNKKYKDADEVLKEVNKRLPQGTAKQKKDLYSTLMLEVA
jgi:hypothetical protein